MNNYLNNITDYEIMKKLLTMKLVPAERIKKYDGISYPVRKWFDLCIVPSVVWGSTYSMDVSFEIAESWGVDMNTVFRDGMANLELETEYMLFEDAMDGFIQAYKDSDDPKVKEILADYNPDEEHCPMYMLTNNAKSFGAASLLNISAMTDIAKHCDSELIVIPSSIHEVLLVPRVAFGDHSLEAITEFLSVNIASVNMNHDMVRPEDRLSDHPYLFGRDYFGEWSYTSLEMAEWEDENE